MLRGVGEFARQGCKRRKVAIREGKVLIGQAEWNLCATSVLCREF